MVLQFMLGGASLTVYAVSYFLLQIVFFIGEWDVQKWSIDYFIDQCTWKSKEKLTKIYKEQSDQGLII